MGTAAAPAKIIEYTPLATASNFGSYCGNQKCGHSRNAHDKKLACKVSGCNCERFVG